MFIPFLLILHFWSWPYSLRYAIQYVKEFKIHSVEAVSEVGPQSNVKIVTYRKRKTWSKGKAIKKT